MSLTDKSFNETYRQSLSSNDLYNIELATNFIKQSSFYNTSLDNTNAFNPDKKQYEDRYVYLDSFTNNREFYDKNLKVDTKLSNDIANFATGFAKGGINLVKDTITGVYYLVTDTKETAKGIANTLLSADTLIYNGFMKSELDTVLGDYESVTARDLEFIAGLTGPSAITNKAVKTAWDRVGKKPSEVTSKAILDDKLNYVFGKATGNQHNIQRSQSMQMEFRKIGINDTPAFREYLSNHLNSVLHDSDSIIKMEKRSYVAKELLNKPTIEYTATVRESFLMGPMGGVKIESVWNGNKLLTIIVKGGK